MATKSSRSSGTQHNQRGVTQGNTLVDPITGLPIDAILDSEGVRRLAVDASVTAIIDNISVDLDPYEDGVYIGDSITGDLLIIHPDGSIDTNTEIDAQDGDNIAISSHPNQLFEQNLDTLTTANYEEVFTFTSTTSSTRVMKLEATSATNSVFVVKINGVVIKQKRSSALEKNVQFSFSDHRQLFSGDILSVEAKIETRVVAIYETFISMEGYII